MLEELRAAMRHIIIKSGLALMLGLGCALPAKAQFSDSYQFLKAVRDRDGATASEYINSPGSNIINTRDRSTGDTALHIATQRRDQTWMMFLLQKGAKPDIENDEGITPLMLTVLLRYHDGARSLLSGGAAVDATNRSGETALIRAVQLKDVEMVRLLLNNGANPDRIDTVAGLSARDYATRDRRSNIIAQEIEKADRERSEQKSGTIVGPTG